MPSDASLSDYVPKVALDKARINLQNLQENIANAKKWLADKSGPTKTVKYFIQNPKLATDGADASTKVLKKHIDEAKKDQKHRQQVGVTPGIETGRRMDRILVPTLGQAHLWASMERTTVSCLPNQ